MPRTLSLIALSTVFLAGCTGNAEIHPITNADKVDEQALVMDQVPDKNCIKDGLNCCNLGLEVRSGDLRPK